MSATDLAAEPASLDPGKPIDIYPVYFWDWVEAVRRYYEPERGATPLSSRVDLYPIIFKRYRPGPNSVPNPSSHISCLRKAGLLRRFGDGSFWIPETEACIRVSGKVLYTPHDLDAVLAGDERFNPPVQEVESAPEDGTSDDPDADAGEDGGGAADEADPPAAEPEMKAKKPHNRKTNPEQRSMVGKLVQALWAAAQPTDDPAWRVMFKSAARDHAVRECGHVLHYTTLYRLGFLKSGADDGTCLVTDPNAAFREALSAVRAGQTPAQPTKAASAGLPNLSLVEINVRIVEREASFSTQALEDQRARVLGEVEAKRVELADVDETRLRLREELRVLETSSETIAASIEGLMMQRQQDQQLQDLEWARANFERLQRVLTGSTTKS